MTRLDKRTTVEHRAGIADRDGVVRPFRGSTLHSCHHLLGRQGRPRGKFPRHLVSGSQHLYMSTPDVHDQHAHGDPQLAFARSALLAAMTFISSRHESTNDFAPSS